MVDLGQEQVLWRQEGGKGRGQVRFPEAHLVSPWTVSELERQIETDEEKELRIGR